MRRASTADRYFLEWEVYDDYAARYVEDVFRSAIDSLKDSLVPAVITCLENWPDYIRWLDQ